MKSRQDIRDDLARLFPDVDPNEEEFHLWLSSVTSHLADLEKDPSAFRSITKEVCELLNTMYEGEGDNFAKGTLTDEVLEFYAHTDDRLALAKEFLSGAAASELAMAKDNVDYWKGKRHS